jgi:hypothetical protein
MSKSIRNTLSLCLTMLMLLLVPASTAHSCNERAHDASLKNLLQSNATVPDGVPNANKATTDSEWLGPAISGSWYDPARNGEGLVIQYLTTGGVLATWFTYPVAGESGSQAWMISDVGHPNGDQVTMRAFRPQGARFGAAFNSNDVQVNVWGEFSFRWIDCNTLRFDYTSPGAYGSGGRVLKRLSNIDQASCNVPKSLLPQGARALSGLRGKSGAWYVPARSGEGWFIEELTNGETLVYWFTYDPNGNQAWMIGIAARNGNRVEINNMLMGAGTRFGNAFRSEDIQFSNWGKLVLDFPDCERLRLSYESQLPNYGNASRDVVRLGTTAGTNCVNGTPVAKVNGAWTEIARLPGAAQSEHAEASLGEWFYIAGGFGDPKGFKRFNPTNGVWEVLPSVPTGRDHPAAFAIDDAVFVSGGNPTLGEIGPNGYRFDLTTRTWQARPELPANFGSHAVVVNGVAYIGDVDGSLTEYHPRTRNVKRVAPPANGTERDHAQVVAFLGEIWVIAGRLPETAIVSIFDPINQRWRAGPAIRSRRGGFAAAVVDDQLVVAGGELLTSIPFEVNPSTEVIAAGTDQWRFGPTLPTPVHGTVGFGQMGEFYLISGSTRAGSAMGATGRNFKIRFVQ